MMFKESLRYGRELFKAGLASAFTASRLLDVVTRTRAALSGPRIHVLGYHRVVDALDPTDQTSLINPALCITTDSFRRQMVLARDRFQMLTLEEVVRALSGELKLERDACAITFDDGYRDVYARAAGVLADLEIPATVFVPTGYAGSNQYLDHDRLYACFQRAILEGRSLGGAQLPSPLLDAIHSATFVARRDGAAAGGDWLIAALPAAALHQIAGALEDFLGGPQPLDAGAHVLSPPEIHALSTAGWEIGAHTIGHVVLTHEPLARLRKELARPRQDIERWTGRPCRFFAYCNGFYSRAVIDEARRAGYLGAVTTLDHFNRQGSDPMRISRKCLWEGHTRTPGGRYSSALSVANLQDLFGDLGMTSPVDGEVAAHQPQGSESAVSQPEVQLCAT